MTIKEIMKFIKVLYYSNGFEEVTVNLLNLETGGEFSILLSGFIFDEQAVTPCDNRA